MKTFWTTEHVEKRTILDTDDVTITLSVSQESGVWAWAYVRVQASAYGITAEEYFGHCSYENADAFRADEYYIDMVSITLAELRKKIVERLEMVSAL